MPENGRASPVLQQHHVRIQLYVQRFDAKACQGEAPARRQDKHANGFTKGQKFRYTVLNYLDYTAAYINLSLSLPNPTQRSYHGAADQSPTAQTARLDRRAAAPSNPSTTR